MAETNQLSLTISEIEFPVTAPFAEGHVITGPEAKALNQTRKENLGNNFRKVVTKALDDAKTAGTEPNVDELQSAFAKLDNEYQFTFANVAAARTIDPVEREARKIVREQLREQLKAAGQKMSDYDDNQIEEIIDQNAQLPEVVAIAKGIVKARQKSASLAAIDLGLKPAEQPAPMAAE